MGQVVGLAFLAAFNPTLVAATSVMLLLDHPTRLMLGYYLGGLMTSVTLGLVIVFSLTNSSTTNTTQNLLSPVADLVLGGVFLTLAYVVATGRDERLSQRRAKRKESREAKGPPKWQRKMNEGTARTTFVIGALLTLPGASYLAGLDKIHGLHYSSAGTVAAVVIFNLVMLLLLELPMLAFVVAPDWTPGAITGAKGWVSGHARQFALYGFGGVGALLVIKGIVGLAT